MSNKTSKILVIVFKCTIVLLVAAALLYFVPWPTRINQQMTGTELSADGTVLQESTMTVKGWKLNYLFQEDQIKLETFDLDNPDYLNLPSGHYYRLSDDISEECLLTSWIWSDSHAVQYVVAFFANDNSWVLFKTDDRYFAMSVEGGLSPEAIWETAPAIRSIK